MANVWTKAERMLAKLRRGRLRHFPRRSLNWYRSRHDIAGHPARVRSQPIAVDIEPTTRCNLRCASCQRTSGDWPEIDLSVELFTEILKQMPVLESVKLMGVGEPLLCPHFFELVRTAKRRGLHVWTISNGTRLCDADVRREIENSRLDEIIVSIDGADAETHARWRGGADWRAAVDGLRALEANRNGQRPLRLGISCVGNPDNINQLTSLVRLAAEIGVDSMIYFVHLSKWEKKELHEKFDRRDLNFNDSRVATQLSQAARLARDHRIEFLPWRIDRYHRNNLCNWLWTSCMITSSGALTRCMIASDPRLHSFGNLTETPFHRIWNGDEYQALRQAHREGQIPEICRPCYGPLSEQTVHPREQPV